jgi:2-polyprenyl-6-methoxyphenol hydroxylase-like FAD-dependent oxidoreductase
MRTALIVGAGIGGLAAAVALRRAGWQVRVHERASHPRELGFALALAPNAIAALEELGLSGAMVGRGVAVTQFEVRHADGRLIIRFSAQPGGSGVIALRSALHGQLLDAVGNESLVLASEAIGFSQEGPTAHLNLRGGGSDRADVIVAADGVGSAIRRQLHPGEPPPVRSGFFAVRGLARGVAAQLGDVAGAAYLGDGVEAAALRASEDAVYWYMSLLAEDVADTSGVPREIADRVARGFDPAFRAIVAATDPTEMRLDELFYRAPLSVWGAGRVTLLGDAAHPVLPHTGQGAAQALEDAVALGLVLREDDEVAAALWRYERVRFRRTRRLIALGPRIARMTTTRNPAMKVLRTALLRGIPEFLVARTIRATDPHSQLRRNR